MADPVANCVFFKKRARTTIRQKQEGSSSSEEEAEIRRKVRRPDYNALHQQTANFAKKSRGLSDDDDGDDDEDPAGTLTYKASRSQESRVSKDQLATATLEIDTDTKSDAQAIFERSLLANKQGDNQTNVYKGTHNYTQYIERKDTVLGNASSGFNRKGPMRAPTNLRATVRWDYQPDVCKDYKETGFCTFGDSCKFLHDRSDYKHGWQIDQELSEGIYGIDGNDNRYEIHNNSDDPESDEDIPWECLICRKDYKDPVVTNCGHYFCSDCALKRYNKTARCYACTADTKGLFKFAKNLPSKIAAIKAKRKKCKCESSEEEEHEEAEGAKVVESTGPAGNRHGQESLLPPEYDSSSSQSDGSPDRNTTDKFKLPVSSEPNWAKPEAPEFCDSEEEESD